jgi:hypothetical protein
MIHVATVHWRSERWIDTQLRYLERFLPRPYRVYAFLDEVPGDHRDKFFYSSSSRIRSHAIKLNLLGDMIGLAADDPSDMLLFIDGDAFPVAPLDGLVEERLKRHQLIAVQRYENNGDIQPHPCFCLTTVGFWQEIGGDWHRDYEWRDQEGKRSFPVGVNLLVALARVRADWYPLRRVNSVDAHPLFFGLYGDANHGSLIYHHGGGFHESKGGRVSRVDNPERQAQASARPLSRALDRLPRRGPLGWVRSRYHPKRRLRHTLIAEARQLSEEVFAEIEQDEKFWRRFV